VGCQGHPNCGCRWCRLLSMVISLQLFSSRYVSELYEAEGQIETRQSLDRLWQAHDCRLLKRADHWALLLTSSYDDWAFVVEVREDDPKREVSWSQGLWNWTSLLHTKRSWIQVETTSVSPVVGHIDSIPILSHSLRSYLVYFWGLFFLVCIPTIPCWCCTGAFSQ
jgi:hypothetical protein